MRRSFNSSLVSTMRNYCTKKKTKAADRIKSQYREAKLLYGELAESKAMRMKRMRKDFKEKIALGEIPILNKVPQDNTAEAEWNTKSFPSRLKFLNIVKDNWDPKFPKDPIHSKYPQFSLHVNNPPLPDSEPQSIYNYQNNNEIPVDQNNLFNENNSFNDNSHQVPLNEFNKENSIKNILKVPIENPERESLNFTSQQLKWNRKDLIISNPFEYSSPRLPSVSKILSATMPPEQAEALLKWEKRMIDKLGIDGFHAYKKDLLDGGKELHHNIRCFLSGTEESSLTISPRISGHWESCTGILSQVENVVALESHVVHPKLNYCGVVDCVGFFRDKLVLIDWKTSERAKNSVAMTYDTPIQIAAYIGAINYDPKYSFQINQGLIVVVYKDGSTANPFILSTSILEKNWGKWLKRLEQFKDLNKESI